MLTEGVEALALVLVLTFLAAAEVLLGGTVCRVGVICRDEGGRVGRAAPGVEGVGVCWRPERRDTSCSAAGSDDVLVVVVEPVVESVTIAVVAVLVVVEPVEVAEAVDPGVEEVAEAGVLGVTPGAAAEVVLGVLDSGLIAVGDVELLRDVLPFPRAFSTFEAILVTTTDTLLPAKAAICSSSFLPTTFAFTALAPFAVLALADVLALFAPVCFLVVGFEAEDAPLSTERRLISDLSDLVEESVSLLLLPLLLDSTISWPTLFAKAEAVTEVVEVVSAASVLDKASNDDTVMEVVDAVEVGVGVVDEAAPGLDPEVVVKVLVNMAAGSSAGLAVGVGVAKRGFSKLPPPGT